MAVEVTLRDDLDGGKADETVSFALDGKFWEIDLTKANAAAFRRLLAPYMANARPATQANHGIVVYLAPHLTQEGGLLALADNFPAREGAVAAVTAMPGPHVQHDPQLPSDHSTDTLSGEASQQEPDMHSPPAAAEATSVPDTVIRQWAKRWSVPAPARGRIPGAIREVYAAFQDEDKGPWRELLEKNGIDPREAEVKAAENVTPLHRKPDPTQDELDRKAAKQVGTLTPPQLTMLRRMVTAKNGQATSDPKTDPSFAALKSRRLCTLVRTDGRKKTYQVTTVGRVWFDVHQINPGES